MIEIGSRVADMIERQAGRVRTRNNAVDDEVLVVLDDGREVWRPEVLLIEVPDRTE